MNERSRCCGVLRGATADASQATTRLFRLPDLDICHVIALAAAHEQPAEAAAEDRYACTESLLRPGTQVTILGTSTPFHPISGKSSI